MSRRNTVDNTIENINALHDKCSPTVAVEKPENGDFKIIYNLRSAVHQSVQWYV